MVGLQPTSYVHIGAGARLNTDHFWSHGFRRKLSSDVLFSDVYHEKPAASAPSQVSFVTGWCVSPARPETCSKCARMVCIVLQGSGSFRSLYLLKGCLQPMLMKNSKTRLVSVGIFILSILSGTQSL